MTTFKNSSRDEGQYLLDRLTAYSKCLAGTDKDSPLYQQLTDAMLNVLRQLGDDTYSGVSFASLSWMLKALLHERLRRNEVAPSVYLEALLKADKSDVISYAATPTPDGLVLNIGEAYKLTFEVIPPKKCYCFCRNCDARWEVPALEFRNSWYPGSIKPKCPTCNQSSKVYPETDDSND